MITSASGLLQKTVLLKYMDSKIMRKDFQSIQESISASLSQTDRISVIFILKSKISKSFHELKLSLKDSNFRMVKCIEFCINFLM